jgi:hypothetical protein
MMMSIETIKKGSWRTTIVGIVIGLRIICTQIENALDTDPATVFTIGEIINALGIMGIGFFARDNKVRSESVGAK